MSDDNNITTNALNNLVDERIRTKTVQDEEYTKGDEGNKIASKHNPLSDTESISNRSWALSEIERTVASEILPSGRQKISQFGLNLARKNDLRLRELTRRTDHQVRMEFPKDQPGNQANGRQISDFDVRSHSLRLISTNATLGSYQFQKTMVLPYMRKSLALDFQKTSLLKKVVGGLTGLEKAVVSKLEAIKMNTAAAAPTKQSLFTRLKLAVRDKQIDRVAGNIANVIMEKHSDTWKKSVAPVLAKLNRTMHDTGPRGGVNGATRGLTRKLNSMRQALNRSENQSGLTRLASGALGGAVRIGQRAKLSSGLNTLVSKPLTTATTFMDKLNPFAGQTINKEDLDELGDDIARGGTGGLAAPQFATLNRILTGWRRESTSRQSLLIEHVASIRDQISSGKLLGSSAKSLPAMTSPGNSKVSTKAQMLAAPRKLMRGITQRVSGIFNQNKPAASGTLNSLSGLASWQKLTANNVSVDFQTGQAVQTSLIGNMTEQLANINHSIQSGNQARGLYERLQTKRQSLSDKIAAKLKLRKNSYEDLLASRGAKKGLANSDQLKATAAAVMASVKSGGTGNDAASADDDSGFDWSSLLGDDAGDKAKDAGKKGWRKTKLAARRGGRGLKGMFSRGARGGARGLKGLAKSGLKGLWGGAKGASRIGGKGLFNLAKGGVGAGVLFGVGRHFLEKSDLDGESKKGVDTLMAMGEYGSLGATVGGPWGAAIGAAAGGIIANADYASKALAAMGNGSIAAVSGLWSTIFGQKAKVAADGSVIQQEKSSLLGDLKIAFFGRKARYSASGETITTERNNLLGSIRYGFEKTLFGDRFNNGEFKEGTSLLSMARDGMKDAISNFRDQLINLPRDLKEGFKKGTLAKTATWAAGKAMDGARGTKSGLQQLFGKQDNPAVGPGGITALLAGGKGIANFTKNFSWQNTKAAASQISPSMLVRFGSMLTPTGFMTGASNAIYGWWMDSGTFDDPATPQYKFVELTLNAYGVKNRTLYKFVHSLETSQEKVNNGQAKAFDDKDMAYMAGRFGFDPKNSDAVNYFKLWYKRRFLPAMLVVDKVLKQRRQTFSGVMAVDNKEMGIINELLKKEIAGSGIMQVGMEPTVQAYNRYAKIGTSDPGGLSPASLNKDKPFDPRDPNNRYKSSYDIQANGVTKGSAGNGTFDGGNWNDNAVAARKKAVMSRGGVKDQPEYKAAYQNLPQNIKKVVDKSRPLQFVLWSTSIQHGPKGAALIFERDYSDQLDESGYLRSIYQDRSRQFGALNENDRASAVAHLGQEQRFAFGIQNGTSNLSRGSMQSMVGDQIDPAGNYNGPAGQPPKGSDGVRAKQALQYLMQKGYTKIAAAGIVGNLWEESKLRTNAVGDSGRAHGIAQWHPDRRAKIAQRFRKSIEQMNLQEQLDAVDWEMRSGSGVTGGKDLAGDLNRAPNAAAAARMVMNRYERPLERNLNGQKRGKMAMSMMNSTGNAPDMGSETKPSASTGTQTPATRPQPSAQRPTASAARPAAKPAPQRQAAPAHDMSAWGSILKDHADAMRENTAAVRGGVGPLKQPSHSTVVSPIIMKGKDNGGGFLSMSMKKSMLVTGK